MIRTALVLLALSAGAAQAAGEAPEKEGKAEEAAPRIVQMTPVADPGLPRALLAQMREALVAAAGEAEE
jgi:hypothetical protein